MDPILAFSDDMIFLANDEKGLQHLLNIATEQSDKIERQRNQETSSAQNYN